MRQLQDLLDEGFPRIADQIHTGQALWPEYTGIRPTGKVSRCPCVPVAPAIDGDLDNPVWRSLGDDELEVGSGSPAGMRTFWQACRDCEALYIGVRCLRPAVAAAPDTWDETVRLLIEPRRLWPHQWYQVTASGAKAASDAYQVKPDEWTAATRRAAWGWSATIRIPIARLRVEVPPERPYRIDLERQATVAGQSIRHTWVERQPLATNRLCYGTANPADFGWLIPE
jgi:hypothetical protein